jgi:hypothetical protein
MGHRSRCFNRSIATLRLRAATAALPHEHPKLAVTAMVNAGDFADQLERAVERSRMIEAKPMIEANVSSATVSDTSGTKSPGHCR